MNNEQNMHVRLGAAASLLWPPFIIGLALILSTAVGAFAFYKVRSFDDSLSVTGSAKKEIVSDTVRWNAMFSRNTTLSTLKNGYSQMAKDEKAVKDFLASKQIKEDAIVFSPVSMDEVWENNQNTPSPDKKYTLRESVTINSNDVALITNVSKDIQSLIEAGVIFQTGNLEYSYSKLAELRVSLLSDAIKDAKSRADQIATASGKSVGQLKSAGSGVVQVLPVNSVEVSDYGTYDTHDIKKDIMVTVKAAFTLR